ncbi:malonate--CoA ligase [Candidatus Raskinella chloraquaticus]|jgi:malonyl-CoA/methylmalonyl-CoA synthetase|uniref:Malonyl-CoA synthase n=1 Tax=Candidatus Raskinella chloraquaticus TaxID=1951219 RepID=A0A1W9HYV8_9HYPH|nr:MAG: malonyl-CoA synthase [Proteobacteria bacterium SG_bin8]
MDNLFSLIRDRMPSHDRAFMTLASGKVYTYRDLLAESGRLANTLVTLGVKPGDRVAVQIDKSPEAVFLYVACLRAGAAFLPLNTAYTLAELDYFVGDAEPAVIVCRPQIHAEVAALGARHKVLVCETLGGDGKGTLIDKAAGAGSAFDDVVREPDDLAAILYTSGTTGRSKGAMLTHRNLSSNALTLVETWRFTADDVLLHALPIFHTHGLFVAINCVLMSGASMLFLPRFDGDEVMALLAKANVMMGVPTFYVRLLQHAGLTPEATRHMRLFVSGSAPLLAETHDAWRQRTGHAILERYGMTETGMITSNPYVGDRIAGTVGFPLTDIDVRVADDKSATVLGQGEVGVLEVRGPNVFSGYWRMPEKTKAEFRDDGFFITGDVGKIDARGYIHIVGRAKDLVISGGYNVYPKEIESEIDGLEGILESAVIGIPHPDFGEGVTAVCVRKPGATISADTIIQVLGKTLAKYKLPKHIEFVDELPRNAMGKVLKGELRTRLAAIYSGSAG